MRELAWSQPSQGPALLFFSLCFLSDRTAALFYCAAARRSPIEAPAG
jgi:hypothetical protein